MPVSPPSTSERTAYARKRAAAADRSSALVRAGQDIAPCPPPRDPVGRTRAATDFRYFCERYFPHLFTLAWSDDHLRVIAKIERTVIHSETFAVAMPRGSGKTTLCLVAVIWAVLEGYHPFVFLIASTAEFATAMLDNIKAALSSNEELLADYPEAVYPIRALEGESRRAGGQRYYGVRTRIGWDADQVVMPTIPGSRCAGAVIKVAGITGNIRGAQVIRPDGTSVRPTLAVVDDPQTDQSARSPAQVRQRLSIINGTVAGLAGPGKRIARVVPCTVIQKDDLADQLLDRDKNPEWQGERTKLAYALPTNDALWAEYEQIRAASFRNGGDGAAATEFYKQNRAAMDAGAVVAWPARWTPGEVSAVQNVMNLRLRDPAAFAAEYQNEPIPLVQQSEGAVAADVIAGKTGGLRRAEVPAEAVKLTAFVDVQGSLLYYAVCAWEADFSGHVVDYGSYPDQGRAYFTLGDAKRTLADAHPGLSREAAIYAGLKALCDQLLGREWRTSDGGTARVDRALVDANWGNSTDIVYRFCQQGGYGGVVMPSHGKFFGAATIPLSEYPKRKGELVGTHWWVPARARGRAIRHLMIDTNFWKSFVHTRLGTAAGDPGCLQLFAAPAGHAMFADHLTAEYPVETAGRGRTVTEWKPKPGRPDNHLFDCAVGCAVAASMCGVALGGIGGRRTGAAGGAAGGAAPRKKKPRAAYYPT